MLYIPQTTEIYRIIGTTRESNTESFVFVSIFVRLKTESK